ncbi:MAG: porin family protein [Acidobacteriia bacterium]|nr:porin family protein [Terriglobia bacterium]
MKSFRTLIVCAAALMPLATAQKWEAGGGVGGGFYTSQDVSLGSNSASAKIGSNIAGSGWLENNKGDKWGGELRVDYQRGDLQLSQGGSTAAFGAQSYAVHYDAVYHFAPNGARVRPFVAIGAGIKVFQGTGTEVVYQALSQFALLTRDQDVTPLISGGVGFKMQLSEHVQLRAEIHDYATPFPKKVITPNSGAKVGGWLQDFVPMVGISYTSGEGR